MKASVTNRTRRPLRVLVKATLDQIEVEVREARGSTRQITGEGVLLNTGEDFAGPLPLNVRRGAAVLGVHDENDTIVVYPQMNDGRITAQQLVRASAEFDKFSEGEMYPASAFVLHLLPAIKGTPEHKRYTETLRDMLSDPIDDHAAA